MVGLGPGLGLPPGWESDYDGRRWFFTYRPTGHVQYHFPSEGDEFPGFVDAWAPAPALAPEERRERQHQVRRHAGATYSTKAAPVAAEPSGPIMTATARPVSLVWEEGLPRARWIPSFDQRASCSWGQRYMPV